LEGEDLMSLKLSGVMPAGNSRLATRLKGAMPQIAS